MIEIYSINYNRPDLIGYQYDSIIKFVQNDYEFIIIDNSTVDEIKSEIQSKCQTLGLKYIDAENKTNYEAFTHGQARAYGLSQFVSEAKKSKFSELLLIDQDVFFCSDFKYLRESLSKYALGGVKQVRESLEFIHAGILYINKELFDGLETLNLSGDVEENGVLNPDLNGISVDIGGRTHKYVMSNKEKVLFIDKYVNLLIETPDTKTQVFYHMSRGIAWYANYNILNQKRIGIIENFLY